MPSSSGHFGFVENSLFMRGPSTPSRSRASRTAAFVLSVASARAHASTSSFDHNAAAWSRANTPPPRRRRAHLRSQATRSCRERARARQGPPPTGRSSPARASCAPRALRRRTLLRKGRRGRRSRREPRHRAAFERRARRRSRVRRGRAAVAAFVVVEADQIERRAHTPVSQFDLEIRRDHDVLELDVLVEHAGAVHVVEGAQQLHQNRQRGARPRRARRRTSHPSRPEGCRPSKTCT